MGRLPPPVAYAASAALHLAALAALARLPPLPALGDDISVEVIDVAPPAPPPPAPTPEPIAAAPEPAPLRPAPRRVPMPRDAPRTTSPNPAPPPPNAEPPEDAPRRAPVRVGVAMSATTEGGSFSAPSGNTLYGEMPRTAPEPDAQAYRSERYVPPAQVTVLPRKISCEIPQAEYPEAARRAGVEGRVVLTLVVDEAGRVAEAKVVEAPGHGLGEAAVAGVRRHCRFEPARKGEERVATRLRYTVRWELP